MAKGKYHEWLTEDGLLLIRNWARNGLTDAEIAEHMGIGLTTLKEWKKKYPTIATAVKKTKEMYDSEVVEALERAAIGYYVEEEEWRNKFNQKTREYELVLYKKFKKWIKPDPTSQIFWLKNRDKLHWRDKQDVAVETGTESAICIMPKREIIQEPKGDKEKQ